MKQKKLQLLQKAARALNSSVIFDELAAELEQDLLRAEAAANSEKMMAEFEAVLNELTAIAPAADPLHLNNLHPIFETALKPFAL